MKVIPLLCTCTYNLINYGRCAAHVIEYAIITL